MKKPEESQLICLRSDSEYRAQLRLKAGALVHQGSISKHKANTHRKDSGITVAQGEWLQARNSPAATPIHHLRGLFESLLPRTSLRAAGLKRPLGRQESWATMWLKEAAPAWQSQWHRSCGKPPSWSNKPCCALTRVVAEILDKLTCFRGKLGKNDLLSNSC